MNKLNNNNIFEMIFLRMNDILDFLLIFKKDLKILLMIFLFQFKEIKEF